MKNFYFTCLISCLALATTSAQAPALFNYQAVACDTGGVWANKNMKLKISILKGLSSGTQVYKEVHDVTTNQYGLFNVPIGSGAALDDTNINNVDWGSADMFLKLELDTDNSGNFQWL